MPEELQSLLEKIQEDGVGKAEAEKDRILSEAETQAAEIIAAAEEKVKGIIKIAGEKANRDVERAENSIRQAARDISLALNAELRDRLSSVVKECVGEAMTPELMGNMILKMQDSYLAKSSEDPNLKLILNKNDIKKVDDLIKGSLLKSLKNNPDISLGHDFAAGIKIGFKGEDLFFDFSDEVISELICGYVGPKLAAVIAKGE